jgi:hypothetical protein
MDSRPSKRGRPSSGGEDAASAIAAQEWDQALFERRARAAEAAAELAVAEAQAATARATSDLELERRKAAALEQELASLRKILHKPQPQPAPRKAEPPAVGASSPNPLAAKLRLAEERCDDIRSKQIQLQEAFQKRLEDAVQRAERAEIALAEERQASQRASEVSAPTMAVPTVPKDDREQLEAARAEGRRLKAKLAAVETELAGKTVLEAKLETAFRELDQLRKLHATDTKDRAVLAGHEQGLARCVGITQRALRRAGAKREEEHEECTWEALEQLLERLASTAVGAEAHKASTVGRASALEHRVEQLRAEALETRDQVHALNKELLEAREAKEAAEASLRRAQTRLTVSRKETEELRELLQGDPTLAATMATRQERAEPADASVAEDLRAQVARLNTALEAAHEQAQAHSARTERAEARADEATTEAAKLRAEIEGMRAAACAATGPGGFKIMHLRMNPADTAKSAAEAKRKDAIAALEAEVAELRAAVAAHSEAPVGTTRAELPDADVRMERLKELFKSRMASLREAIYVLTGWKVDMHVPATPTEPIHVRLRSMYFAEETDCLEFHLQDASGASEIQILDTPLARSVPADVTAYLTMCHSFPAYLSALTLEHFEKQTQTLGLT